ncbi:MAG: MarR family EPS-associated transcriptional regulator [Deltaproteobacteria bacterium]|nr:MarR family EPS-associated transcriptional regulator [Deltaproteobacteria bacterium]
MNNADEQEIRYRLLKVLDRNPDLTQRQMAREMGVSLGKVNYCLSELAKRGFIKVNRFRVSRNKIQYLYIITPHGFEEKARLTLSFLKRKLYEYEEIRRQIRELSREAKAEGLDYPTSGELPEGLRHLQ